MGDPRRIKKKYQTPSHPWQGERIKEEKEIVIKFGLKNKKEVWKMQSALKKIKRQTKSLIALSTAQADKEMKLLLAKLAKLKILPETAQLDEVLGLKLEDILNRRLQTILFKKGLARTIKQARQFIVHGHITLNNQKITVPAYLVKAAEENQIGFTSKSTLKELTHPERVPLESKNKKNEEKTIELTA